MRKNNDSKIYVWEMIIVTAISLFTMLSNQNIVSLLFRLTFIMLLFGLFSQLHRHHYLNDLHMLAILIIVIAFINLFIRTPNISSGYFNKFIIFSCTVLITPYIMSIAPNQQIVKYIMLINITLATLYPIMYFLLPDRGFVSNWLTLNFSNPNLCAMYLLHATLYCFIGLYYYKKVVTRVFIGCLTCILIYLIFITESRSCYVAIALFLILFIKTLFSNSSIQLTNRFTFLILLAPLLIMFFYIYLSKLNILDKVFYFLDLGEGKAVTSRDSIWINGLKYFSEHPFLGNYYYISGGSGTSQLHNTHLDIMTSYGIIPMILFLDLLFRAIKRILPNTTSSLAKISLFAFFAIIIQGTFEAALVSGGIGLYILSFGFLLIARCTNNSSEHTERTS